MKYEGGGGDLLDKSITSTATLILLLELHKFKLTEWFEDILEITLSNAEMDISNVEPMKRNRVMIATGGFRITGQTILLSFGQLGDDWDS
jgi:hypothetical protein